MKRLAAFALAACTTPEPPPVLTPPTIPSTPTIPTLPTATSTGTLALTLDEVAPRNQSLSMDEALDRDDWIEISNLGTDKVVLAGWSIEVDGVSWALPDEELRGDKHQVVWLDGEPEEGPWHAPMTLDGEGGSLTLVDPEGGRQTVTWEDVPDDVVVGRFPPGSDGLQPSILASPGNRNPVDPGTELDPSTVLFPEDEILRIDISLPPESLDALRADPYGDALGSLSFGGVTFPQVGVAIKGGYGSFRTIDQKAALRINLDAFSSGARLRGMEHLTLNNMVQDSSCGHERQVYRLLRDAGIPAPRVAHAELYMDGAYRGLYLLVETVDDQFLQRWFDDPNGNLYEGAYGPDLTASGIWGLEWDEQGSDDVDDRSELLAIAELLAQAPTEDLADDLEALIDLDRTLPGLAVEVLVGHWDGYFYSPNNYRLYHEPSTNQTTLLLWGTDQTFGWTGDPWGPAGDLAWWILEVPSLRARFDEALADMAVRLQNQGVEVDVPETAIRVRPSFEADPYREADMATFDAGAPATVDYVSWWPDSILDQL